MSRHYVSITAGVCLLCAVLAGCSKKITKAVETRTISPASGEIADSRRASPETKSIEDEIRRNLVAIYFDFDQYTINAAATERLGVIGRLLNQDNSIRVRIEGNCDERGAADYNISLGEKRAWSIKEWLTTYGVASARLETVSYGEERPAVADCMDEGCHGKNRRGDWNVLSIKAMKVSSL